ncbi:hypothetical protein GCM10009735_18430 [Actinomadura chokoriensis]
MRSVQVVDRAREAPVAQAVVMTPLLLTALLSVPALDLHMTHWAWSHLRFQ